jgi:hypothetical protein
MAARYQHLSPAFLADTVGRCRETFVTRGYRTKTFRSYLGCKLLSVFGVPYGNRTRVAAVKEKRPNVIQRKLAAWIALYGTLQTHEYCYWTLNGRAKDYFLSTTPHRETQGHHWTAVKFCI